MRHRRRRNKIGTNHEHRKALLKNLVRSLVIEKSIKTTLRNAKAASAYADQMVTLAKRGDLHAQRRLISKLGCNDTAKSLIKEIAPHFKDRQGGYTRVLRLGARAGDAAELALLEFTAMIEAPKKPKTAKKGTSKKKATGSSSTAAPEVAPKKATKSSKAESSVTTPEAEALKPKKESEKKGGFLGTLRKFLKGDENK